MIEYPDRSQLDELIRQEKGVCVSILMPTHESGRETNQNSIRFKNLVGEAIKIAEGASAEVADRLLGLSNLQSDIGFWRHQTQGLAIFVCEGFEEIVKLPHAVEETVYAADHFYLRPLAAACGKNAAYALAISWERARLFHCDACDVQEIVNDSFPALMDELVLERDAEEQLQLTSHRARGQGTGPTGVAMYHGHGEGEQKIEADRNDYLARVGRLIEAFCYGKQAPLVLVATDEVAGHFTSTANVEVIEVIQASPDGVDDNELKTRIAQWHREHAKTKESSIHERLGTAIAHEKGSSTLEDIVLAAANGRVETLVLRDTVPHSHWGTFDREQLTVQTSDDGSDERIDLVNVAVHDTLSAGGDIEQCETDEPDSPVAAIYRF